jgi:hypothetical protein
LTRVTRIFQKKVLTKAAPTGPGETPLPGFLLPDRERRQTPVERNLWMQGPIAGAVSLFPDCYLQCVLQLQRVAGSRLVFRPREAMNGRDNNAAVISEQRESHDQNLGAKHLGQRAEG